MFAIDPDHASTFSNTTRACVAGESSFAFGAACPTDTESTTRAANAITKSIRFIGFSPFVVFELYEVRSAEETLDPGP
jgi:hypothetical protein